MRQKILYPTGQQDFKKIREEGKVYVDKTGLIPSLINNSHVFLSRPRRFGKSLLLSTLRYYFEGEKELFKGLEIYNIEKEWKKYPVLCLELSRLDSNNPDSLRSALDYQFSIWEKDLDLDPANYDYSQRFAQIIKKSCEMNHEKVVVLVDEYDNPLINSLHKDEMHESYKSLLKSIYSNLKSMDEYLRFVMLTGVSRFSKAGIFSGLNNLNDISFDLEFSTICGFTEVEIKEFLWLGVETLAEERNSTPEEAIQLLKMQYDGYHFSDNLIDTYNPFSLLNCLSKRKIANYWIDSGTPTFLVRKLKDSKEPFQEIFNKEADSTSLAAVDSAFTSPAALLFQTGYLTIKSYNYEDEFYKLGIPNKEVRDGLFSAVLSDFSYQDRIDGIKLTRKLRSCLDEGKVEEFLEKLQGFFAGIPYKLTSKAPEIYFENNLYVIFQMMGHEVTAEDETSRGRIDLTVKTKDYIYVIEIKVDKSAREALEQIERKGYARKYTNDGRKVICIGINFSSEERNITEWEILKVFP